MPTHKILTDLDVGGTITTDRLSVFTSNTDRATVQAGSSGTTGHLYLNSYENTDLHQLTWSGANNGFYPQGSSGTFSLGLSGNRWSNVYTVAVTASGELEGGSLDINGAGDISGNLNLGGDVTIINSIIHAGDTNTYFGFHDNDQWRVVTGGTERFEVTDSTTTVQNALTVVGNLTANGNIIGDDSTNITNIASIGADTYSADADSTTRIGMSATSMDFLVEDEDVFNCSSTTLTVDAKLVAKKRVLAKTSNTDANADGEIVYFGGTTSMDAGKIYYFNSSGAWALADADAESTAKGMLGVALGSASDTNGVLIRGMVTLDHDPGTIGDTVFLSTTAGQASSTAPSGNGDIVRVVGYCLDSTNGQVYFNPDGTFVEVTA